MTQNKKLFNAIFTHPSGAVHLPAMQIAFEIERKLLFKQDNLMALSIKEGLKGSALKLIKEISEAAHDNYNMVADILGIQLTDKIINFNNQL